MTPTKVTVILGAAAVALTPVATAAAQKPPKNTLTLSASPNPITYGSAVTLSGKLGGSKIDGQSVALRSDPFPFDTFKNAGSATTNAAGNYSLAQQPLSNTRYQATKGGAASGIVTVLVRPRVSLRLSDSTPKRGQRVRFSGRVCPEHDGSALLIQRRFKTGYRSVSKTALRDIPGSTCSSYRRTFRVYRDGRYRAAIAKHGDHFTGVSGSRVANAHR